jgi:hypothetical protein
MCDTRTRVPYELVPIEDLLNKFLKYPAPPPPPPPAATMGRDHPAGPAARGTSRGSQGLG